MKRVAVALVDSLLTAMVRADGDALVMHVGERPIVVAGERTIDLSTHGMNLGAMVGMLGQLLSGEALASLKEFGAVEHALPSRGDDRFSVVAARSGDDIWIEIRRRREPEKVEEKAPEPPVFQEPETAAEPVPEPVSAPAAEAVAVVEVAEQPTVAAAPELAEPVASDRETADESQPEPAPAPVVEEPEPVVVEAAAAEHVIEETPAVPESAVEPAPVLEPEAVLEPAAEEPVPAVPQAAADIVADADVPTVEPSVELPASVPELVEAASVQTEPEPAEAAVELPAVVEAVAEQETIEAASEPQTVEAAVADVAVPVETEVVAPVEEVVVAAPAVEPAASVDLPIETPSPIEVPAEAVLASASSSAYSTSSVAPVVPMEPVRHAGSLAGGPPSRPVTPNLPASASDSGADQAPAPPESPVTRTVRIEVPERAALRSAGLDRLLRAADGLGAAELFLVSQARPYVRVGGNVRPLVEESALAASEIDALLAEVTPESQRDAVRRGDAAEWLIELPEIGRVRCSTFRDLRGPGANFHFAFLRATTADELQLSADTRRLATEPDGLILVTGGAASDMSAIVAAFVDILNQQRADYIVTLEPQVRVVHVNREALISQREVGTDAARVAAAVRAALRETPDVLVIEGVSSGEVARLAIEAASQDRLVIASIDAPSAPEAVQRFVELVPEDQRAAARSALSHCFRGAVAQLLLRKVTGGRIAARELLSGTRAVARVLADGNLAQLGSPDAGVAHTPMADTIVEFVRTGVVDVREAVRKAPDREMLLARLNAAGVDLSALDR